MSEEIDFSNVNGPKAGLIVLGTLALIFLTIIARFDPNRWIFTGIFAFVVLLSVQSFQLSKDQEIPIQNGPVVFFTLVWLGMNAFADLQFMIDYHYFELSFQSVISFLFLPIVLVWAQPHRSDNFFGFTEIDSKTKIKSIWKFSVILIILIRAFELPTYVEFVVLIPLIVEPVQLYQNNKKEMPLLTLHIQQELFDKFEVPISMLKGIFLIMITFTFNILQGSLWLLVILGYLAAGFIWMIDFVVPQSVRGDTKRSVTQKEMEIIKKTVKEQVDNDLSNVKEIYESSENIQKLKSKGHITKKEFFTKTSNNELTVVENTNDLSQLSDDATIGEKAHALGRKVRTELQKPQYNLNHIMSTLSKEDFNSAFRVPKDGLIFDSKEGHWSPPKDLILFPLELEDYDYRRADEILLLGFNKPISTGSAKINMQFGNDNEYNTKISGNQIQIGDTTFHMKTLVLTRKHWDDAKKSLEIVNDVEDISYTGFKTLHDLQEKLTEVSEKWIQLRKQAEEAAINFLAGLLGSNEPVFIGKEDLEKQLLSSSDVEIENIEED